MDTGEDNNGETSPGDVSESDDSGSPGRLSPGAAAGIGVGVAVAALAIVAAVFFLLRRRKQKQTEVEAAAAAAAIRSYHEDKKLGTEPSRIVEAPTEDTGAREFEGFTPIIPQTAPSELDASSPVSRGAESSLAMSSPTLGKSPRGW